MTIILGIDPGSQVTGFGCLRVLSSGVAHGKSVEHLAHGVIVLPKGASMPERLRVLAENLEQVLTKYKPDQVVIEKIFLGKNADSAFKLGHARGVAMSESAKAGAEIFEYATRVIKKGIGGKGSADKEQVAQMVCRLLGLQKIIRHDASDALALALFQAQQLTILRKLQRATGLEKSRPAEAAKTPAAEAAKNRLRGSQKGLA